jgi:hypothetical protein
MKAPICPHCNENECMEYPIPKETIINIPFTKIEIRIFNWYKPQFDELCSECAIDRDRHSSRDDQAYEAGFGDGYEKALTDSRI